MSDVLFVECPIHLDAVSISDILVFKCGHGFCEPCLEEHFAHQVLLGNLSCPTCRKPVRRKEAFSLFLTPAPTTGSVQSTGNLPTQEARITKELREVKAAHAGCSERSVELQNEVDALRQDGAHLAQTMQHLRGRCELLEERVGKEENNSARAREENNRMKEEVARLQVENLKTSKALEEALKEVQEQLERVKTFQGYIERYKRKCNLERKKRKAIEDTNSHLPSRKEDDSLMVVDANAPDMLQQDGPDFGWLDEACRVKGDQLAIQDDDDMESVNGSEDEVQFNDSGIKQKQREDQAPGPRLQFRSDWNLRLETLAGPPSGNTRKHRRGGKVGGSRMVKVKIPAGNGNHRSAGNPLAIDSLGRIRGTVALGSRQKLRSKN